MSIIGPERTPQTTARGLAAIMADCSQGAQYRTVKFFIQEIDIAMSLTLAHSEQIASLKWSAS
ncbi:uncharacterized protein PHALS_05153 [Plasmopara halstedii]|uniref:Uncharacterized protein n=1 Tax=Plasmopara halstedii TaxID=4781 RepID=A0A0N7L7R6_PLAHL|nr:uncharacterized protein PHALS_05153 [Plasmopara halstedii]CEG47819.1 hypothetical protein PHALS_05153 [Plasmopara halstedii]|eukprot:XP_024584188.1 hypothetical protein PHALS_05153 [Plasmopara halstedii]